MDSGQQYGMLLVKRLLRSLLLALVVVGFVQAQESGKPAESISGFQEPVIVVAPVTTWLAQDPFASPLQEAVPAELLKEPAYLNREVLGGSDQIQVSVFGQPDLSAEVTVSDKGTITLPLIGTVIVEGKTPAEVEKLFASRLSEGKYLHEPKVAVQIVQQRSRGIYVLGEVQKPGRIPLQGQVSLLDALSLAGGLTVNADDVAVIVHREGSAAGQQSAKLPLNLNKLTTETRALLNQSMLPGDVIYVGKRKVFFVNGEVRKPGMYVMEEELTVMRVLSIGGGVSDRGSLSRIMIHRKNAQNEIVEVPAGLADAVLPGDVVFVKERLF